jgi:hypothetical protein
MCLPNKIPLKSWQPTNGKGYTTPVDPPAKTMADEETVGNMAQRPERACHLPGEKAIEK